MKLKKIIISLVISLVAAAIMFFVFWYFLKPMPRIDKKPFSIYDAIGASAIIFVSALAICLTYVFGCNGTSDGINGDYFDCSGGAGGIMD